MKIAFLGDSITEGIPGVSYVKLIDSTHQCINYGKGGDTVISLHKRIKKIKGLEDFDAIILFVGINDLFGKINIQHKILKILTRQQTSKNMEQFQLNYTNLLEELKKYKKVYIIPPLLLGEDITNDWNQKVKELANIIETVSNNFTNIQFIDIRKSIWERLSIIEQSKYLPKSLSAIINDVKLESDLMVDKVSSDRGLLVTLDGVHINSLGAKIISDAINEVLKNN
jgi:lysophospholipase L1-like esterase